MKHLSIALIALFLALGLQSASAQQNKSGKAALSNIKADKDQQPAANEPILTMAEQAPSFDGNLFQWLAANLQYPSIAAENGIQGRVVVKFVVEPDGSVTNATVTRGVDPSLDQEALRLVNAMPKWKPGMNNGKYVRVWYNLPVSFRIE